MATLPPILVVNLDRDCARLEHMRVQLGHLRLPFLRVPGVLGDDVPTTLKANFFDDAGRKVSHLKRGEIGCYASHLAIYQRMIAGEFGQAAIVLEDDIEIAADFAAVLVEALRVLPKSWDLVRLSNVPKRAYVPVVPLLGARDLAIYSKIPNSTGAYLISIDGARKLIGPRRRQRAIDNDLQRGFEFELTTFGVVPAPVKPDVFTSTIDALEGGRLDKTLRKSILRRQGWQPRKTLQQIAANWRALGPTRWAGCLAVNGANRLGRRVGAASILPKAARWMALRKTVT